MNVEGLARQAYQAYCEHMDWQDEKPLARWEELPPKLRIAWQVVALRVCNLIFHRAQHLLLGVADQ